MVTTMLRIAADIDRLDELSDQESPPVSYLQVSPALLQTGEGLRARAEQAAYLKQCPVLRRLVEDDHKRRHQK